MYKRHRYIEQSLAQRGMIVTPALAFVLANSPVEERLCVTLDFHMCILLLSRVLRPEPESVSFAVS
jgi:hypothetical protein